jgi:lipopolysaccharide heptosyltransferase II
MIAPDHTQVSRLVVRAPNWLGDAVLALPAMAALRRHFASAHLTVAAPASVAPLFREATDARPDAILVLPSDNRAATRALGAGAFELGILFPNSFRSAWMLRRAGIPQRWGIARGGRGWLLTRRSPSPHGAAEATPYATGASDATPDATGASDATPDATGASDATPDATGASDATPDATGAADATPDATGAAEATPYATGASDATPYVSGAKYVGRGFSRANSAGRWEHHVDYYRNLVRGLGIPCEDDAPVVTPSAHSRAAAATVLEYAGVPTGARLVGIAPGAAYGQAKQWPPARMAALMARLIRDRDVTCVVVGAAHDRPAAREIESWLRAQAPEARMRVVDVVGRTDLGSLVALASMCRVFVSNDSGAMHVAAATGRPVVALFGPTDERVTRPIGRGDVLTADVFCRPCHLRDCPIDHRCMKRIDVDTVFAAVSRHLAYSAARVAP